MSIDRIIFTGDILRPSWQGSVPTQNFNIQWCYDLLRYQVTSITGLPAEMIAWNNGSVTEGKFDLSSIRRIYAALGLRCSIDAWAQLYNADRLPENVEVFFANIFRKSLVIGFELPPYLEAIFNRYGIPFVDIIVHPARFLDDICFGVRTSSREANKFLAPYHLPTDTMRLMAGIQSAAARRNLQFETESDSGLLLLQTRFDRSQIRGTVFVGATDFLDSISELASNCSRLYVKPHPLDRDTPHLNAVLAACKNAELSTRNVYTHLAAERLAVVASLSSSVCIEADFFRKRSIFLYRAPNEFANDGRVPEFRDFVPVFDAFLSGQFWADTLAPILPTNSCLARITVPFKVNRLRTSLRNFWGFNEIDTDVAVHLGSKFKS